MIINNGIGLASCGQEEETPSPEGEGWGEGLGKTLVTYISLTKVNNFIQTYDNDFQ